MVNILIKAIEESISDNKKIGIYSPTPLDQEVVNFLLKSKKDNKIDEITFYTRKGEASKSYNQLHPYFKDSCKKVEFGKTTETVDVVLINTKNSIIDEILYTILGIHSNSSLEIFISKIKENDSNIEKIKERFPSLSVSRQMHHNGQKENFIHMIYHGLKKNYELCEETIFACVYKSGGEYDHHDVHRLFTAIKHNTTKRFKMVCLTDKPSHINPEIETVKLNHPDFKRWWSKIELFRPDVFNEGSNIVYIDLDTLFVDNIDFLFSDYTSITGIRDFYKVNRFASGLMGFKVNSNTARIYFDFCAKSEETMKSLHGDQNFIARFHDKKSFLQDMFPGKIKSFKKDAYKNGKLVIPNESAILCFHGRPKMKEVHCPLFKKYWLSNQ